ncbi:MAG: UDP-N-acetylmuramyl-tripeptide synthetase [bacterium]
MLDKVLAKIKRFIPEKVFKALWPLYHFLLGVLGNIVYRWPSHKLIVIGVTGTTGKTTSVFLIAKALEKAGYKVGYTSTAMFGNGETEWLNDKKMTMVGRWFTFKIMRQMVKNKCQYAVIETSSEGIVQYRHRFINYDILIFTGLYPEHIESHGSFENYKETKGMLFAHLKDCATKYVDDNKKVQKTETGLKKLSFNRVKKTIIVNGDDENSDYFLNFWAEEKIKYRLEHGKVLEQKIRKHYRKVIASNINMTSHGTSFKVDDTEINLKLLGEFSIVNAMNAVCAGLSQGLELDKIKPGLENVSGIPGRLEPIDSGQNFTVIVDYAFEPKAIEKLYETIKLIPHKKVIHVLGSAGGGRDQARRPILGNLAGHNADYVVVTNEDPYDDDPHIIIDQVVVGAENAGKKINKDLFKIYDRQEAIAKALSLAEKDDMVLITGKGSEQAICLAKGEKVSWDDREVVRQELDKLFKK